jgi:homoserine dehydrogenase
MLYGRGAGDMPTASAVISDIVFAAQQTHHHYTTFYNEASVSSELSFDNNWECEYFLRMVALDQPGVLAKVAGIFGNYGVSLSSVMQRGKCEESVPLIFITHKAKELSVKRALDDIRYLPEVVSVESVIRVER